MTDEQHPVAERTEATQQFIEQLLLLHTNDPGPAMASVALSILTRMSKSPSEAVRAHALDVLFNLR